MPIEYLNVEDGRLINHGTSCIEFKIRSPLPFPVYFRWVMQLGGVRVLSSTDFIPTVEQRSRQCFTLHLNIPPGTYTLKMTTYIGPSPGLTIFKDDTKTTTVELVDRGG